MGSGGGPSLQDEVHKQDLKALEIIMEGDPPVMYRSHGAMIEVVSPRKGVIIYGSGGGLFAQE